jgi:inner membrane protein involved in colicin E2 resistance
MYIHMRVIGLEIVIPTQRFMTMDGNDDVIIAQYALTIPGSINVDVKTKLELRQQEFYPSALYEWSEADKKAGMEIAGNIFLGKCE